MLRWIRSRIDRIRGYFLLRRFQKTSTQSSPVSVSAPLTQEILKNIFGDPENKIPPGGFVGLYYNRPFVAKTLVTDSSPYDRFCMEVILSGVSPTGRSLNIGHVPPFHALPPFSDSTRRQFRAQQSSNDTANVADKGKKP